MNLVENFGLKDLNDIKDIYDYLDISMISDEKKEKHLLIYKEEYNPLVWLSYQYYNNHFTIDDIKRLIIISIVGQNCYKKLLRILRDTLKDKLLKETEGRKEYHDFENLLKWINSCYEFLTMVEDYYNTKDCDNISVTGLVNEIREKGLDKYTEASLLMAIRESDNINLRVLINYPMIDNEMYFFNKQSAFINRLLNLISVPY